MPRCKKRRCCRFLDGEKVFKPLSFRFGEVEIVNIFLDEFEAIRLCDHEKLSQIEASAKMKVSRGTVQRLLESGRFKIVDAILNNKVIKIVNEGGQNENMCSNCRE